MKTSAIIGIFGLAAATSAIQVSYDESYDQAGASLLTVSCSDGQNGLAARFPTFGSIPVFPYIGGAPAVTGWNSPGCGTCWKLSYNGRSINVLAIDKSDHFNIALGAMKGLVDDPVFEGAIDATYEQVDKAVCGL